ncbi:MAG: branched-chain amino acid ABC transporter permease [Actinobacteria bacterium]|jgi:branched-chain amino acid transport system permease protein|nr:branched-chain amino acid ABC transporter permease [Actinomycetota bacterium]NDC52011.1 branched-chain amino acid ABC transporter permease [Actinomycetota bacterium]
MQKILESLLIGLSSGSVYALMSLALVLVWRSTRVVNFAQAGQAILSTYIGFEIASRTGDFWISLIFAVVAGALIGAAVDVLLMRILFKHATSGPALVVSPVIATLGLLGLIRSIVGLVWGGEYRSIPAPASKDGFTIGTETLPFSPLDAVIVAAAALVLIVISILFTKTNLGLALRASAYAPEIARLAGIRTSQTRTIGWAIAGGVGGVAGMLISSYNFLSPYSLDLLLVFGFIAAVIGGLESMIGAVVGAMILGIGLTFVSNYVNTSLTFITGFLLMIFVLLIKPQGVIAGRKGRRA